MEFRYAQEVIEFSNEVWDQLQTNVYVIATDDRVPSESSNLELLESATGKAIVYLIHAGPEHGMEPVYLGQTTGRYARQRVRNHLFKKHKRTGAQLVNVREASQAGQYIGFSFVEVSPSYMRHAVEEILIDQHALQLSWNKQGKTRNGV